MSSSTALENATLSAERALRAADPAAFPVAPRIVRRVIRHEHELPGLQFQVPHRHCYVIDRDRLWRIVEPDEVGIAHTADVPETVILIARPDDHDPVRLEADRLLVRYWRVLFHARVHVAIEERIRSGELTRAGVRRLIHHVGQTAFDEVRAVLRQESQLLDEEPEHVWTEFVALYLELRWFQPALLEVYFPSLHSNPSVGTLLDDQVDAEALLEATRLSGAPRPALNGQDVTSSRLEDRIDRGTAPVSHRPPSIRACRRLLRIAAKAAARGNNVRAAILRLRAADCAEAQERPAILQAVDGELDWLTARLQAALGFADDEAAAWRYALAGLLANSSRGFWNPDARLLYDLQKVCLDHERDTYVVDLAGWLFSFGRRPVKRALPNQREVLMSKHLRSAARRLNSARLAGVDRNRLAALLDHAAHAAERQLRARLRPLITTSLAEVGLRPENVPEQVAFRKLVEELIDKVVHRGFLNMGDLRDAVSRNQLKLPDLADAAELIRGDRLLRADRALDRHLDGVYERGEFYLRWLQRLSSAAFGTRTGRFLTRYLAIPFGGSYVILSGIDHLAGPVGNYLFGVHIHTMNPASFLILALFLLGILNVAGFRALFVEAARGVYKLLRGVFVDFPRWLIRLPVVRDLLRSNPVRLFRRHILTPLALTAAFWFALPKFGTQERTSWISAVVIFLSLVLVLNSRAGREIEEITAERIARLWHLIRVRLFVALYDLIMDTFKQVLEVFERAIYEVDEWLRFKSGESPVILAAKGVLGLCWAAVAFLVRIYVTLLIEPQVNPIKHFPVVTVSHKIILPLTPMLTQLMVAPLEPILGKWIAYTVVGATVFLLPGIFGFLVWELKENWRLYSANRRRDLTAVPVGHHGETISGLLKPGLHSGTVPKLYQRLRRTARGGPSTKMQRQQRKFELRLEHAADSVVHFIDREFVALLEESRACGDLPLVVGKVTFGTNSILVPVHCSTHSGPPLRLMFEEQSGWILARIAEDGWLADVSAEQRQTARLALLGLFKKAGADLQRSTIEACFAPRVPAYDVAEDALVVWPDEMFECEITYSLRQRPVIVPRPREEAARFDLPAVEAHRLIFGLTPIAWKSWVDAWHRESRGDLPPPGDGPDGASLVQSEPDPL